MRYAGHGGFVCVEMGKNRDKRESFEPPEPHLGPVMETGTARWSMAPTPWAGAASEAETENGGGRSELQLPPCPTGPPYRDAITPKARSVHLVRGPRRAARRAGCGCRWRPPSPTGACTGAWGRAPGLASTSCATW